MNYGNTFFSSRGLGGHALYFFAFVDLKLLNTLSLMVKLSQLSVLNQGWHNALTWVGYMKMDDFFYFYVVVWNMSS
jgi:hypothetical protein